MSLKKTQKFILELKILEADVHVRKILCQLHEFQGARLEAVAMIQVEVVHIESRSMQHKDWEERILDII